MLWEFVKHKLAKLGCFATIAFVAILIGSLTKWVLSWSHYDPATADALAEKTRMNAMKVLFGCTIVCGLAVTIYEQWTKWRKQHPKPPPLPPARRQQPPALPQPNKKASSNATNPPPSEGYAHSYDKGGHYKR